MGGYKTTLSTLRAKRKVFSYKIWTGWKIRMILVVVVVVFFFLYFKKVGFLRSKIVQKVVERALGLLNRILKTAELGLFQRLSQPVIFPSLCIRIPSGD